jgi:site-specific DNA-methyltransferase (adenine-specific)
VNVLVSLKISDELKREIPPLSSEELILLENSIIADGVRDALVVWRKNGENVLVDGHNRYSIAQKHGKKFEVIYKEFEDLTDVKIWIRSNQMARRNLTDGWKAELALRTKEDLLRKGREKLQEAGEKGNTVRWQKQSPLSETDKPDERLLCFAKTEDEQKVLSETDKTVEVDKPHNTQKEIAKELGWSVGKVACAEYVKTRSPEIWEKAKTGEFSINKAYEETKKVERKAELLEERKKIAESSANVSGGELWNIEQGNIETWNTKKTYDFIITDPPYPKEFLPLYETLAIRATEWLKPGGLLIAMCGQSYLDQIHKMLSKHLDYYWTACYLTPGQPTPLRQVNVNTTWKPLLIYKKKNEKYTGKIFGDVFKSDGNDKEFHKWGQSISGMYDVISKICIPGQSVLDPFCGAGTTGIAAIKHKCFFDGIDIEEENVKISKRRIYDSQTN